MFGRRGPWLGLQVCRGNNVIRRSFRLALAVAAVVFVLPQPAPAQAGITGTCSLSVMINFTPNAVSASSTTTNGWAIPETDPPTDDGTCTIADVGQGSASIRISTTPSVPEHLATCEAVRLSGTGTVTLTLLGDPNDPADDLIYDFPISIFIAGSLQGATLSIQPVDDGNPFLAGGELATHLVTFQQCLEYGVSSAVFEGTLAFDS